MEVRVGSGCFETVRDTLREVRYRLRDPLEFSGRVEGPSWKFWTERGTPEEVRNGSGTVGEFRHRSGDPRVGPGLVGGTSGSSETARGTLRKVHDGSGEPQRVPGGVGGP